MHKHVNGIFAQVGWFLCRFRACEFFSSELKSRLTKRFADHLIQNFRHPDSASFVGTVLNPVTIYLASIATSASSMWFSTSECSGPMAKPDLIADRAKLATWCPNCFSWSTLLPMPRK